MSFPSGGRGLAVLLAVVCLALAATGGVAAPAGDTVAAVQPNQGEATEVTIENSSVQAGETVRVTAIVENTGPERATIPATLTLDGESVATREPSIDPEFPVVVTFEVTVDEPGEYTVAVDGTEATETLSVQSTGGEGDADEGTSTGQATRTVSVDSENVTVERVELGSSPVPVGETVDVTATLVNTGPDVVNVSVALELDGEVVASGVAENVLSQQTTAGVTIPYTFQYTPEQSGTYAVSVNGTEAGGQLTVSGGGGGPFGFLGFLPLGILRLAALFVLLPFAAVYLVLKALAIYLGY